MVRQVDKQELNALQEKGIVTTEKYDKLLEEGAKLKGKSVGWTILKALFKAILIIGLTILAIIVIFFGVCFVLIKG